MLYGEEHSEKHSGSQVCALGIPELQIFIACPILPNTPALAAAFSPGLTRTLSSPRTETQSA